MSLSRFQLRSAWHHFRQVVTGLGPLSLSDGVGKAVSFLLTVYLARVLGEAGFGLMGYVQSLFVYVALAGDLGVGAWAARETARGGASEATLIKPAMLKFLLSMLAALSASVVAWIVVPPSTAALCTLCFSAIILQSLNLEWFLLGKERFKILSAQRILRSITLLALMVSMVRGPLHITSVFVRSGSHGIRFLLRIMDIYCASFSSFFRCQTDPYPIDTAWSLIYSHSDILYDRYGTDWNIL